MAADIKITLVGDASDLNRELDKVEKSLKDVDKEADKTGDGIGRLGDSADAGEQRIMGLRDMIDGTAAIMAGPGEAGISAYLQGWADMASGIANFAAPALAAMKTGLLTTAKTAAATAKSHVLAVGKQVAAWVVLGAKSMMHAAKVAAAWLISMGPIALVIAAVVGLVLLIVKNWDKIKQAISAAWEWVKRVTKSAWDWLKSAVKTAIDFIVNIFKNWTLPGLIMKHWDKIKEGVKVVIDFIKNIWNGLIDWFKRLPDRVGRALSGLFNGLKNTFRSAVNWVIDKWNNFRLQIKLPGILGGGTIGIDTPNIPRLHTGGLYRSPVPGGEGLALLKDKETVLPPGSSSRGSVVYNINVTAGVGDPVEIGNQVLNALRYVNRVSGPLPITVRTS